MADCGSCRWWVRLDDDCPDGECHACPPQIAWDMKDEKLVPSNCWPVTTADDWCGQYRMRPAEYPGWQRSWLEVRDDG